MPSAPAHLDALTLSILDLSDLIVVVTDAITPSVLGARRFLDLCAAQGLTPDRQRVVLNRYQGNEGNLDLDTVERQLGTKVSHVVPEERLAIVAANSGVPLTLGKAGQKTEFSRVVRRLAEDCATARPERAARGMA